MSDQEQIEKKEKHPLDLLPKSPMALDACKRLYNDHKNSDKKYFTAEFSSMFDSNGYSLFKSHYKYNSDFDGRLSFVNNNYIKGVVQNLDDMRKYLFGSLVLFKTDDRHEFVGYWIMRGSEPTEELFDTFFEDNEWEKVELSENVLKEYEQAFYEEKVNDKTVIQKAIML